jgi:hypothetical protein
MFAPAAKNTAEFKADAGNSSNLSIAFDPMALRG